MDIFPTIELLIRLTLIVTKLNLKKNQFKLFTYALKNDIKLSLTWQIEWPWILTFLPLI